MIERLTELRAERERAALDEEKRLKRNRRLTGLSLRVFIIWPILAALVWIVYRVGYESGSLASFARLCLRR